MDIISKVRDGFQLSTELLEQVRNHSRKASGAEGVETFTAKAEALRDLVAEIGQATNYDRSNTSFDILEANCLAFLSLAASFRTMATSASVYWLIDAAKNVVAQTAALEAISLKAALGHER